MNVVVHGVPPMLSSTLVVKTLVSWVNSLDPCIDPSAPASD